MVRKSMTNAEWNSPRRIMKRGVCLAVLTLWSCTVLLPFVLLSALSSGLHLAAEGMDRVEEWLDDRRWVQALGRGFRDSMDALHSWVRR